MSRKRYAIERVGGEVHLVLNKKRVSLYSELTWHFGADALDGRLLQLTGAEFELFKQVLSEMWPQLYAFQEMVGSATCSGETLAQPKHMGVDAIRLLLAGSLITQTERDILTAFLAKHDQDMEHEKRRQAKRNAPTFIYLMKDERSGYIKIGRSVTPAVRERTLQAENPMIVLLHTFEGTQNDEKQLHQYFAFQRVRGEWFELDDKDIQEIVEFFERRKSERTA